MNRRLTVAIQVLRSVAGKSEMLWPLAMALSLPAAIYWRTLAPSVVIGDSAEFQTEVWRLGVVHPTGYPFYLLLGRAFALVVPGDVAFRLNLFSTFAALVALAFFYMLLARLTGSRTTALVGTWLCGAGSAFWSQAIIAEVYALHAALIMAALYFAVRWGQEGGRWGTAAALAVGLGLAHHRTIVLLLPAMALYLLAQRKGDRRWNWRVALGALLLPSLLYIYVPLRWPVVYGRWPLAGELVDYLLGRGYSYALRPAALADLARLRVVLDLGVRQFTWGGVALGLVGVVALAVRHPRELLLSGSVMVAFLLFGLAYQVPDVAVFLIPAWMMLALWIGIGAHFLAAVLHKAGSCRVATVVLIVLTAFVVAGHGPRLDRSSDLAARELADATLAHPPLPGALVICDFERLSALRYAFGVERPDLHVEVNMPDTEDMAFAMIDAALAAGRPVYLARLLPGVAGRYRLSSWGTLIAIQRSPRRDLPDVPLHQADARFYDANGAVVRLLGYEMPGTAVRRGERLVVTLYWRADFARLPLPYRAYLQLVDDEGNVVSRSAASHPVADLYPLNAWQPGEVVADRREMVVNAGVPPGVYRLQVGWCMPFGGDAPGTATGSDAATLTAVEVLPNPDWRPSPQTRLRTRLSGAVELLGFDLQGRPLPGRRLRCTLYLRRRRPGDGLALRLRLMGTEDEIASADALVLPDRWEAGESFPLAVSLLVPEGLHSRAATLRLQCSPLGRPDLCTTLELSKLRLELPPPAPGERTLTSFDDRMMLLAYRMDEVASPGGVVRVELYWWAMAPMDEDYAVFVHLLDDEGRVKWQHDGAPAFGTRPTSSWQPGDVVADVHEIPLPPDAPTGAYRVEVGVYSPLTWQRLRILDTDGRPVADHLMLIPVQVRSR